MGDGGLSFALDPKLDPEQLARIFAERGRIHIPSFLAAGGAERLYRHLRESAAWRLVLNSGDKVFELDRPTQESLTEEQREKLDLGVFTAARQGFQFRFETIRVPDREADRRAEPTLLNDFASFLSSEPVVDFFRRVTGADDVSFADAQGTAYGPGHFLTAHDDDVEGKQRRAAYVFNLTPEWRMDWGGLLLFHAADGHVEEGYAPRFNALNIFAVPAVHSVSYIAPFAAHRRYSVTGWLRAGSPG